MPNLHPDRLNCDLPALAPRIAPRIAETMSATGCARRKLAAGLWPAIEPGLPARRKDTRFALRTVRLALTLDREKTGQFGQETVKFCARSTPVRERVTLRAHRSNSVKNGKEMVKFFDRQVGRALRARRKVLTLALRPQPRWVQPWFQFRFFSSNRVTQSRLYVSGLQDMSTRI